MKILVNLRTGNATLYDDFGEPAARWTDPIYADDIRHGRCTKRRWADMLVELAQVRGYLVKTDKGWTAVQDESKWNLDLPPNWVRIGQGRNGER